MIDRRALLCGTALLVTAAAVGGVQAAARPLRVGSVKYGSLSWVLDTIRHEGLDAKAGLNLEVVDVASNQAGPVTLLAGGADIIVSDWTWAMRQRGLGEPLKFAPYSSALGALVVPKESAIRSIGDLKGKKLGVAGSAIDKSWLLLRAYAKATLGKDINDIADASFGAAPLLTEEIRSGRIDAVLNFWTHSARLTGSGYTSILTMADVMKSLGIEPVPPLVGFIWKEEFERTHSAEIALFLDTVDAANRMLATTDAAWERLRPLIKPASDGELAALKEAYREGIPPPWGEAELRSAEKLMQVLVGAGDKELVGEGTVFDAKLFHHAAS